MSGVWMGCLLANCISKIWNPLNQSLINRRSSILEMKCLLMRMVCYYIICHCLSLLCWSVLRVFWEHISGLHHKVGFYSWLQIAICLEVFPDWDMKYIKFDSSVMKGFNHKQCCISEGVLVSNLPRSDFSTNFGYNWRKWYGSTWCCDNWERLSMHHGKWV